MKITLFFLILTTAFANILQVGTKIIPPFVQYNYNGKLEGFSIDLLDQIIKESELYSNYNLSVYETNNDIFDSLINNVTDIGHAAITKTYNRENLLDFTHSFFDSGLQIMLRKQEKKIVLKVFSNNYIENITSSIFISLIIYIFSLGHIMWFLETRLSGITKDKVLFNHNYFRGVIDAIVWVFLGSVGKENRKPNSRSGKTCSMMINFMSIWIAPIITSYLTLIYLTEAQSVNINSVNDLIGKKIGTVKGTVAVDYLRNEGFSTNIIVYNNIDDMFNGFENNEFYAVIYDFPVLNHYINSKYKKGQYINATIAGPILYKQKYGICTNDYVIEEEINKCLMKIINTQYYDTLYNKWLKPIEVNNNNDQTLAVDNKYTIGISLGFGLFVIIMWIMRHARQLSEELEFMKGDTFNELDYYYWKLDNILNFSDDNNELQINLEDLLHLYSKNMRLVSDKRRRKDPDANYTEHELLVKIITIIRLIEIECEYSWKRTWDLEKFIKKDINRNIFIMDKKIEQMNIMIGKIFKQICPNDDSVQLLDLHGVKFCNSDSDSDCGCEHTNRTFNLYGKCDGDMDSLDDEINKIDNNSNQNNINSLKSRTDHLKINVDI